MLTTSPYTLNWVYKELIKPTISGRRKDIALYQAATWENPYNSLSDPKILAQRKATMDPRRFSMLFGGEWGKMQGLVYDSWSDDENFCAPFELPHGTRYFAGVDWGFTDPFVIKVRALCPDGRQYGVSEFYQASQTVSDMVKAARAKSQIFNIECFICDPSQPGYIEEFNRNKLTAVKANNDIRLGIDAHYELIKSRRYKEFEGTCPNSHDEREIYHYPEPDDLGPDQNHKELVPVDAHNHAMDVDRYLTLHLRNMVKEKVPQILKSTDPFAAIFKKSRSVRTENWK